MGGPQCMLGWVLGAVIALCDGLVWSELARPCQPPAALTFTCAKRLRKPVWAVFCHFLFIWQFIFSGPLEIASGISVSRSMSVTSGKGWHHRDARGQHVVGVLVIVLLYRRVASIGSSPWCCGQAC